MAESSRSRVTITLGRGRQVVKRAGPEFDGGFSESQRPVGGKRSVRDRLGGGGDAYPLHNKRRREDNDRITANDSGLGKNDLRYKLLQKSRTKQGKNNPQQSGMDLRQTLSRRVQSYESERKSRQKIRDDTDSRLVLPQRRNDQNTMHAPPTRTANVLPIMEPIPRRNTQSSWSLERLGELSPNRDLNTSRTLSSVRREDEVIKKPVMRSYDDVRAVSYMNRDFSEPRRTLGTTSYMAKPVMTAPPVKPVMPQTSRPLPTSGAELKKIYRVDERMTVDSFLYSLGLEKYIIPFKAEEVDMATLRQMGERDLKELGIPMVLIAIKKIVHIHLGCNLARGKKFCLPCCRCPRYNCYDVSLKA